MKRITIDWLREHRACGTEVFKREWPDGCEPTLANLLRAVELGLSLDWFATYWLSTPMKREYEEKLAPIDREYEEKRAAMKREYEAKLAPLVADLCARQEESL